MSIETEGIGPHLPVTFDNVFKEHNLDGTHKAFLPAAHNLGGAQHNADTLANLNSKVSDATLIDTADARLSDDRDPNAHVLSGARHTAPTALMQYVPVVIKASVAFDDASPKALITVQDGDIIKSVWAEVTTVWDGDGTVTLGDGAVPAGFAADVNLTKGFLGYKLYNEDTRGSYLWDGPNAHPRQYIYTGVDTIDAVIVTGTSTQGAMDVYFEILRLKP